MEDVFGGSVQLHFQITFSLILIQLNPLLNKPLLLHNSKFEKDDSNFIIEIIETEKEQLERLHFNKIIRKYYSESWLNNLFFFTVASFRKLKLWHNKELTLF